MFLRPFTVDERATFPSAISEQIWDMKYRLRDRGQVQDVTVEATSWRVAHTLADVEAEDRRGPIALDFYEALCDFRLLPAGRILAGAGASKPVTLFNTFVMDELPDSVAGVLEVVRGAGKTLSMGGGIGFDFSTMRPAGHDMADDADGAPGPLVAMDVCDSMASLLTSGPRRGAMMATMRCDHPDIEAFVESKSDPSKYRNFNISVLVTDAFMEAVEAGTDWNLVWDGRVVRRIPARTLWDRIMAATYQAAEPGVLFIDRINARNPLAYCETISATNSCGEQPLPPNGACPLSAINLARLVRAPFTTEARLDLDELRSLVRTGVRMLDNVIELSRMPLPEQRLEALAKRRIGLGVTGVADALVMLGETYGSAEAAATLGTWMREIQHEAYRASVALAREKGAFPLFDADRYCASPTIRALDPELQADIRRFGVRNALVTSIAPVGTTSLYAGNVSSGIEPIFATSYRRKVTQPCGTKTEEEVVDYAVHLYREMHGVAAPLPETFVTAMTLAPLDHVRMQAAAQEWVCAAISKTVNCPEDISFAEFEDVYMQAWKSGCKGCTTYRPNPITGSVLAA